MWVPSAEDYRALQLAGGLTLAVVFGAGVLPPLRRHRRALGLFAVAVYVAFGLGMILYHAWRTV